jgi:hypothetical protein
MMMPLHSELSPQSTIDYYSRIYEYSTMTQICNLMIVPCNQLVCMVIADDASDTFDDFTLRTVSMEYNIILSRIYQQYSQIYTN